MKMPSFSLRSLLLVVLAIALFLPHYPFVDHDLDFHSTYRQAIEDSENPPFIPRGLKVRLAVWQTIAAELAAVAGWLLLRRLKLRRANRQESPP